MAVNTSTIPINSGNNGWTNQHVLDALEEAFDQLGMNDAVSYANTGVPAFCEAAGYTGYTSGMSLSERNTNLSSSNWMTVGGSQTDKPIYRAVEQRYFHVVPNGTTSFYMMENWICRSVNTTDNTVSILRDQGEISGAHQRSDMIDNGDKLTWAPGESDSANADNIGGLTPDTDYYIGDRSEKNMWLGDTTYTTFKVYSTEAEALAAVAGTEISLTSNPGTTTGNWRFQRPQDVNSENKTIDVYQGTTLNFTGSTGMYIIDTTTVNGTAYHVNSILNTTNYDHGAQYQPTGQGTDNLVWDIDGWQQTEDEVWDPTKRTDAGYQGIYSYGYAHDTNTLQKGVIKVLPHSDHNAGYHTRPYWKYTVPASGGRSELKLRIHRHSNYDTGTYNRRVCNVTIHSVGSGWTDDAVFTIPGEEIGGVATTHDIEFGTNTAQSASNAGDGKASIKVTTIGQSATSFQKSQHGQYIVCKLDNDTSKSFGTTYWAFGLQPNQNRMVVRSGVGWNWLNNAGTRYVGGGSSTNLGQFQGDTGLDIQGSYNYLDTATSGLSGTTHEYMFATSSTPEQYPIEIRTYRATGVQDTDFAVIQFVQSINQVATPFFTFIIHRGNSWGTNVADLDYVWNGSFTEIGTSTRSIKTEFTNTGYSYAQGAFTEPADDNTLARELSYGYIRNASDSYTAIRPLSLYKCNIDTTNSNSDALTYFRDNTYDKNSQSWKLNIQERTEVVAPDANYYRPIKGIPISNQLVPCPYYMPDDFALIQVSVSPGATEFRPGDTITISGSEIYTVIRAGYDTSQTGLNNTSGDQSMGMLFCARTT